MTHKINDIETLSLINECTLILPPEQIFIELG
jgi:hypothetical protein